MRLTAAATALTLLLTACSSTDDQQDREAPDVQFQRALVLAVMPAEERKEVEDAVVAEIKRRRPNVKVTPTYEAFPDLETVTAARFRAYVQRDAADLVVTIMPFAEVAMAEYDEFEDVSDGELHAFVEETTVSAVAGRFGIQVVGWRTSDAQPVYAKTSEIFVGAAAGPAGVAEFAAVTVTREL